jgi:hypothetical protein
MTPNTKRAALGIIGALIGLLAAVKVWIEAQPDAPPAPSSSVVARPLDAGP